MHDLPVLERQLINTNGINILASLLETAMVNTIYLIKPKQLYIYKKLTLFINNEPITIHPNDSIVRIRELNASSKLVTRLIITGYNDSVIDLSYEEIKALRGFKLVNHVELAIEYYKSTIFDILYQPDLISLCRRNPKLDDIISMDVLDMIEASPSLCLTDNIIEQINLALNSNPDIKNTISMDLTPIRNLINKYTFNPKEFTISRYNIRIHILEDIRIIRFNELLSRGDVDDNEDSSGVYIKE
jgi:hypothetical protein